MPILILELFENCSTHCMKFCMSPEALYHISDFHTSVLNMAMQLASAFTLMSLLPTSVWHSFYK